MNRYIRYFVATVFTFLLGVGIVYLYVSKLTQQITEMSEFSEECSPDHSPPTLETLGKSISESKPISGMEILLTLYKPTINKWEKGERIPRIVHHSPEIVAEIVEMRKRHYTAQTLETGDIYKTQLADLNGDNQNELIILQRNYNEIPEAQDLWNIMIFQKSVDGISLIFDERMVNDFRILKTKTKGFSDIAIINRYEEEMSSFIRVFRSNGEIHNILSCYVETYGYKDRKGIWHKLKKPRIEYPNDCC